MSGGTRSGLITSVAGPVAGQPHPSSGRKTRPRLTALRGGRGAPSGATRGRGYETSSRKSVQKEGTGPLKAIVPATLLALVGAVHAHAQTVGALKGTVTDAAGASVPGVTVTVSSLTLQGPREAVTDSSGAYVILGLPPGSYELRALLAGFAPHTQPNILLRAGSTINIDVQLELAGLTEAVTVTGRTAAEAPIIDVQKPELHFHITGEFLTRLPLGSRQQWDQLWQLVPGVVTIARSGDGDIEPQIHGASERSNVMKLDGFDIGNAFTNQAWTTQFSTEVIQDVLIKTAGLDASTPLGRGGFLNIVTKSGGNSIRGAGAMFLQPRRWNDNNVPGGRTIDQSFYQPDVSLGGPARKDRTWYFASYRRVYVDEGVPRSAAILQSFREHGFDYPTTTRSNGAIASSVSSRIGSRR